jgi:diphosphomevalonate decarboxylase
MKTEGAGGALLEASATAHPNIALAKYWGKRAGEGNYPAVPSLSVSLAGMQTRTRVAFRKDLACDRFILDEQEEKGRPLTRVTALLDEVRAAAGLTLFAEVTSRNDFPTASGLASSSSGFAALAVAALAAARLGASDSETGRDRASDLARRASVSAARSVLGGFVELDAGPEDPPPGLRLVGRAVPVPASFVDSLRVLVAVAGEGKKATSSTDGMRETASRSPYYASWLQHAPRLCGMLREGLLASDFERVGAIAEGSALAMHASAIAAGVKYWNAVTMDLMAAVLQLRARGTAAYFTIDAGPHVKVLVRERDAELAGTCLRAIPGVTRVLETRPGPGARVDGEGGSA